MIIHRLSIYGYIEGGTITWSVGKGGGGLYHAKQCFAFFCVPIELREEGWLALANFPRSQDSINFQINWFILGLENEQSIDKLLTFWLDNPQKMNYIKVREYIFIHNKWISKFLTEIIGRVYFWIYCQSDQTKITNLLWL